MNSISKKIKTAGLAAMLVTGASASALAEGMPYETVSDLLHLVMKSDRTVYTKQVVNRLAVKEKVIKASEHFDDDKALPLPAQMFRFGAELVAEETDEFTYSLLSLWPINKQNAPATDLEKEGLQFIADNPGENFYGEEELGGVTYFTAVYADVGVAEACVSCHNGHKDSPRTDFKLGEVMGGVVIRIPKEE
ncbi:Tll0287-like domain-containing protein [Hwanghaeella sp.]|uniref:Tll0287-like domain-containing protein n=1 Tax=Hwanghaeella sp. TaxID=2605943 RepID=UPI003CCC00C9